MTSPTAVFRVDASISSGIGHFMRCRALALKGLARGWHIVFLTVQAPDDLQDRIRKDGCDLRVSSPGLSDADEMKWLVHLLENINPAVCFLDGYAFEIDYQRTVKPLVKCLVCLDDRPGRQFECDIVLNQNLGVALEDYTSLVSAGMTLLLGPRFALLAPGFLEHACSYHVRTRRTRVLVTMGGSDEFDYTSRVLTELAVLPPLVMDIVLGPLYPHSNPMERIEGLYRHKVQIHRGLESLLNLARDADIAVTAGGSTVWELACLGMPMIVLGTAENQAAVLEGLRAEKAAEVLGYVDSLKPGIIAESTRLLLADSARLHELSQRASRLVDGQGVERVAKAIDDFLIDKSRIHASNELMGA